MGGYDEEDRAKDGLFNLVGSCCGTFPSHIYALITKVKDCKPRVLLELPKYPVMQLSGLEPGVVEPELGVQVVGTRCVLRGSAKSKKLVDAYK